MTTQTAPQTTVIWLPRDIPSEPVGVAARGAAAVAVARRLVAGPNETFAGLTGVSGDGFLIVLGKAVCLPWADGVVYLGRDPSAAALLTPTTHAPSIPILLLANAITTQSPGLKPPFALIPDWPALISLSTARTVARESLTRWLAHAEAIWSATEASQSAARGENHLLEPKEVR